MFRLLRDVALVLLHFRRRCYRARDHRIAAKVTESGQVVSYLESLWAAVMSPNPLLTDAERIAAYWRWETETWLLLVLCGALHISDLDRRFQEPVKALIIQRANHMA